MRLLRMSGAFENDKLTEWMLAFANVAVRTSPATAHMAANAWAGPPSDLESALEQDAFLCFWREENVRSDLTLTETVLFQHLMAAWALVYLSHALDPAQTSEGSNLGARSLRFLQSLSLEFALPFDCAHIPFDSVRVNIALAPLCAHIGRAPGLGRHGIIVPNCFTVLSVAGSSTLPSHGVLQDFSHALLGKDGTDLLASVSNDIPGEQPPGLRDCAWSLVIAFLRCVPHYELVRTDKWEADLASAIVTAPPLVFLQTASVMDGDPFMLRNPPDFALWIAAKRRASSLFCALRAQASLHLTQEAQLDQLVSLVARAIAAFAGYGLPDPFLASFAGMIKPDRELFKLFKALRRDKTTAKRVLVLQRMTRAALHGEPARYFGGDSGASSGHYAADLGLSDDSRARLKQLKYPDYNEEAADDIWDLVVTTRREIRHVDVAVRWQDDAGIVFLEIPISPRGNPQASEQRDSKAPGAGDSSPPASPSALQASPAAPVSPFEALSAHRASVLNLAPAETAWLSSHAPPSRPLLLLQGLGTAFMPLAFVTPEAGLTLICAPEEEQQQRQPRGNGSQAGSGAGSESSSDTSAPEGGGSDTDNLIRAVALGMLGPQQAATMLAARIGAKAATAVIAAKIDGYRAAADACAPPPAREPLRMDSGKIVLFPGDKYDTAILDADATDGGVEATVSAWTSGRMQQLDASVPLHNLDNDDDGDGGGSASGERAARVAGSGSQRAPVTEDDEERVEMSAAVRIQAAWRGCRARLGLLCPSPFSVLRFVYWAHRPCNASRIAGLVADGDGSGPGCGRSLWRSAVMQLLLGDALAASCGVPASAVISKLATGDRLCSTVQTGRSRTGRARDFDAPPVDRDAFYAAVMKLFALARTIFLHGTGAPSTAPVDWPERLVADWNRDLFACTLHGALPGPALAIAMLPVSGACDASTAADIMCLAAGGSKDMLPLASPTIAHALIASVGAAMDRLQTAILAAPRSTGLHQQGGNSSKKGRKAAGVLVRLLATLAPMAFAPHDTSMWHALHSWLPALLPERGVQQLVDELAPVLGTPASPFPVDVEDASAFATECCGPAATLTSPEPREDGAFYVPTVRRFSLLQLRRGSNPVRAGAAAERTHAVRGARAGVMMGSDAGARTGASATVAPPAVEEGGPTPSPPAVARIVEPPQRQVRFAQPQADLDARASRCLCSGEAELLLLELHHLIEALRPISDQLGAQWTEIFISAKHLLAHPGLIDSLSPEIISKARADVGVLRVFVHDVVRAAGDRVLQGVTAIDGGPWPALSALAVLSALAAPPAPLAATAPSSTSNSVLSLAPSVAHVTNTAAVPTPATAMGRPPVAARPAAVGPALVPAQPPAAPEIKATAIIEAAAAALGAAIAASEPAPAPMTSGAPAQPATASTQVAPPVATQPAASSAAPAVSLVTAGDATSAAASLLAVTPQTTVAELVEFVSQRATSLAGGTGARGGRFTVLTSPLQPPYEKPDVALPPSGICKMADALPPAVAAALQAPDGVAALLEILHALPPGTHAAIAPARPTAAATRATPVAALVFACNIPIKSMAYVEHSFYYSLGFEAVNRCAVAITLRPHRRLAVPYLPGTLRRQVQRIAATPGQEQRTVTYVPGSESFQAVEVRDKGRLLSDVRAFIQTAVEWWAGQDPRVVARLANHTSQRITANLRKARAAALAAAAPPPPAASPAASTGAAAAARDGNAAAGASGGWSVVTHRGESAEHAAAASAPAAASAAVAGKGRAVPLLAAESRSGSVLSALFGGAAVSTQPAVPPAPAWSALATFASAQPAPAPPPPLLRAPPVEETPQLGADSPPDAAAAPVSAVVPPPPRRTTAGAVAAYVRQLRPDVLSAFVFSRMKTGSHWPVPVPPETPVDFAATVRQRLLISVEGMPPAHVGVFLATAEERLMPVGVTLRHGSIVACTAPVTISARQLASAGVQKRHLSTLYFTCQFPEVGRPFLAGQPVLESAVLSAQKPDWPILLRKAFDRELANTAARLQAAPEPEEVPAPDSHSSSCSSVGPSAAAASSPTPAQPDSAASPPDISNQPLAGWIKQRPGIARHPAPAAHAPPATAATVPVVTAHPTPASAPVDVSGSADGAAGTPSPTAATAAHDAGFPRPPTACAAFPVQLLPAPVLSLPPGLGIGGGGSTALRAAGRTTAEGDSLPAASLPATAATDSIPGPSQLAEETAMRVVEGLLSASPSAATASSGGSAASSDAWLWGLGSGAATGGLSTGGMALRAFGGILQSYGGDGYRASGGGLPDVASDFWSGAGTGMPGDSDPLLQAREALFAPSLGSSLAPGSVAAPWLEAPIAPEDAASAMGGDGALPSYVPTLQAQLMQARMAAWAAHRRSREYAERCDAAELLAERLAVESAEAQVARANAELDLARARLAARTSHAQSQAVLSQRAQISAAMRSASDVVAFFDAHSQRQAHELTCYRAAYGAAPPPPPDLPPPPPALPVPQTLLMRQASLGTVPHVASAQPPLAQSFPGQAAAAGASAAHAVEAQGSSSTAAVARVEPAPVLEPAPLGGPPANNVGGGFASTQPPTAPAHDTPLSPVAVPWPVQDGVCTTGSQTAAFPFHSVAAVLSNAPYQSVPAAYGYPRGMYHSPPQPVDSMPFPALQPGPSREHYHPQYPPYGPHVPAPPPQFAPFSMPHPAMQAGPQSGGYGPPHTGWADPATQPSNLRPIGAYGGHSGPAYGYVPGQAREVSQPPRVPYNMHPQPQYQQHLPEGLNRPPLPPPLLEPHLPPMQSQALASSEGRILHLPGKYPGMAIAEGVRNAPSPQVSPSAGAAVAFGIVASVAPPPSARSTLGAALGRA